MGVLQSQSLHSSTVVQVPTELIVGGCLWKGSIAQKFLSLFDYREAKVDMRLYAKADLSHEYYSSLLSHTLRILEQISKHAVEQRGLSVNIATERGHVVRLGHFRAEVGVQCGILHGFRVE